jgi:diguanylate cyclase (GGDEF)-like protein/PAS domain S-box-containing protein
MNYLLKAQLMGLTLNLLSAVIYIVLAKIGLFFALENTAITIFWPAGGFALALLLLGGLKYLPGIFLGGVVVGFMVIQNPWVATTLGIANVLESYIAYWLATSYFHIKLTLESKEDFWKLTLLASAVASVISALIGPTALLVGNIIPASLYPQIILRWWMGDVLGIAFLTPLILIWIQTPQKISSKLQALEIFTLLALTTIMGLHVFLDLFHDVEYMPQDIAWIIMLISWAGIHSGRHVTAVIQLIIFTLALWSVSHHIGHYANDMAQSGLLNFWLFGMASAVGGLTIAVISDKNKKLQNTLAVTLSYQRSLLDNFPFMVWLKDTDSRFLTVNTGFANTLGLEDSNELIGKSDFDISPHDIAINYRNDDRAVMDSRQQKYVEEEVSTKDGRKWFETYKAPIINADGSVLGTVGFARDITEQKKIGKHTEESEERLRLALVAGKQGWFDLNIQTGEISVSPEYIRMIGYDPNTFHSSLDEWKNSLHPDDREATKFAFSECLATGKPKTIEYRRLSANGSWIWISSVGRITEWGENQNALRMVGTHTNISKRKRLEEELKRQAHIDYLTGLNNRGYFMELAEHELNRSIRYENPLSILMIDIDFFKQVNDSYGHKAGDAVLKKLGKVCRLTLREIDIIGRVGGEEFAILLPETDKTKALEVAERLRIQIASTKVSPTSGRLPLSFTVSIGLTTLSSKEDVLDVLLSRADNALYEAKAAGRNRVCVAQQ